MQFVPSRRNGRHFFNAGHVLATATASRFAQVRQTDGSRAMARTTAIRCGSGQMLQQIWLQSVRAAKVGGQYAEQAPGALR